MTALRVVSWNVLADGYIRRSYYPRSPGSVFDRDARRRRVLDRLASYAAADAICLQEADVALVAAARATLPWAEVRHLCKPGRDEGVATLFHRDRAAGAAWRELGLSDGHVALAVQLGAVVVVNTHLRWEPDETPAERHRGRAQLAEILGAWPTGTRVLCGDFNAERGGVVLALAEERGLRDAYAALPRAYTCNANAHARRIDFILHTPDLRATPEPVPAVDDLTPLPGDTEPSDHVAIAATLDTSV